MREEIVKCRRCGRRLRGPQSMTMGMGPTCARKLGLSTKTLEAQAQRIRLEEAGQQELPLAPPETWVDRS